MINRNLLYLALTLLLSSSAQCLEVIQGNSQQYISTMEGLINVHQKLNVINERLTHLHAEGYQLPNGRLSQVLEHVSQAQILIETMLQPERTRTQTQSLILDGEVHMKLENRR